MISEEMLDAYATVLAGRLMMLVHLDDVRTGFHSESMIERDHDRLLEYGYDRASCLCLPIRGRMSVSVWRERVAQKRSSKLSGDASESRSIGGLLNGTRSSRAGAT